MNTPIIPSYIIDTDPGYDDAMAIMLALRAGMNMLAITTVSGNSTIQNTTRNAAYILDTLGRNDIPLYSGAEKPLSRDLVQAFVHGKSGLDGIDPQNEAIITNNASDKILEILSQEEAVTIIALGPLTNIAKAIQTNPAMFSKAKELIIMGGAIRVPGNKNRVAEFNIFVDPEAADIVFRFPIKKTIIPLDVCNRVPILLEDFERVHSDLREPLLSMVKPYIQNINDDEGVQGALMYDPLTVYFALKPEYCTVSEMDILIETEGVLTRGMTVADLRKNTKNENLVQVVENIDTKAFTRDFIDILNRDSLV